jgi:hypothetical protein
MADQQRRGPFASRPKSKTPAERSVEFDAHQAQLKADAAERRQAREGAAREASAPGDRPEADDTP